MMNREEHALRQADLSRMIGQVSREVMRTPTGPIREKLTDASLHLQAAHTKLEEAQKIAECARA